MDVVEASPVPAPCTNWPDAYYASMNDSHAWRLALEGCKVCPIVQQCLSYALKWEDEGIWGGKTPNQRRDLKRDLRIVGSKSVA